ncbi:3-oxoacyl-reductase [Wallemia mellicola]|uniref:3-oxoacyl-reductase n=1 Tax=Wallemia mellicola TaxID=1708541 RepID=A0A4T0Q501_9BASI|nr:3-oxoacyl-reductase [Wallemia mellicola]TIC19072.1 3-oxoacyl-reductase [Wallemia mellicola]
MSGPFEQGYLPEINFQNKPGLEANMPSKPVYDRLPGGPYKAAGKLEGKVALVTGGDSGIGRSTSLLYTLEGASLVFTYLPQEERDAKDAIAIIKERKSDAKVHAISADLRKEEECIRVVDETVSTFGKLDILFNNHGTQTMIYDIKDITTEQWHDTFNTNIHPLFYLSKAALKHMREHSGATILNNASVNAYIGRPDLLDYTATKGAVVSFTRGLANQYINRGIRVNAVAPGPIQAPLRESTMEKPAQEGFSTPMGRPGESIEIATAAVFLVSDDSSFITGQTIHVNGGSFTTS